MKVVSWILLFLISFWACFSLFQSPNLFSAHDIWHNIARFYHYYHSIMEGNFPPYWVPTLTFGYGYPLFFFSFPLPWIIGFPLLFFGVDLSLAYKLLLFLSVFISALTSYWFCLTLTRNRLSAMLGAILYVWAPFHFLNLFVSGAIGVLFVFSFLPLFFLGIYSLSLNHQFKLGIVITGTGFAFLVLSHLISVVFLLPGILGFWIWCYSQSQNKKRFLITFCLGCGLGILISSFYLIPSAVYNKETAIRTIGGFSEIYAHNFVNFSQIIYSRWGFGPITNDAKMGEISLQLGFAQWLGLFGSLGFWFFGRIEKRFRSLVLLMFLTSLIYLFLMVDYSSFIWQELVKIVPLDYPFRALLPLTFITVILGAVGLSNLSRRLQIGLLVFLSLTAFYNNRNYAQPNIEVSTPVMDLIAGEISTNTFNEYRPIKSDPQFFKSAGPKIVPSSLPELKLEQNYRQFLIETDATQGGEVSIGHLDFVGLESYVDEQKVPHQTDLQGRIKLFLPAGKHLISARFEPTLLIKLSLLFSVIGVAIALALVTMGLYESYGRDASIQRRKDSKKNPK